MEPNVPVTTAAGSAVCTDEEVKTEQIRPDHQAAPVPAVGEDAGDRAEEQQRQVLRGDGQPGGPQRPGGQEDMGGDGQRQQPRAESADQAARPQQPEIPYPQRLEHDRHPVHRLFCQNSSMN